MQIKVEVEVKPEELRRFLGLPDVAGLQDEVVNFLKDKMDAASDGLSPAADFVKGNIESLRRSLDLQKLLASVKVRISDPDKPAASPAPVVTPVLAKKRKAVAAGKSSKKK